MQVSEYWHGIIRAWVRIRAGECVGEKVPKNFGVGNNVMPTVRVRVRVRGSVAST